MKSSVAMLVLMAVGSAFSSAKLLSCVTFGPVFNWSFGSKTEYFSYGVNAYYWEFRDGVPWSLGGGYERGSDRQNIVFAEAQTGVVVYGVSSGVVYSTRNGIGAQGSLWGNFIGGGNLRYRYLGEHIFCPGVYMSYPARLKTEGTFN